GEDVSPAEYQQRYGVATDDWPGTPGAGRDVRKSAAVQTVDRPGKRCAGSKPLGATPSAPAGAGCPAEATPEGVRAAAQAPTDPSSFSRGGPAPAPPADFRPAQDMASPPQAGTDFLGFRLLAKLGQGAFGQVFLAQQGDLANRYVALKISTKILGESQT